MFPGICSGHEIGNLSTEAPLFNVSTGKHILGSWEPTKMPSPPTKDVVWAMSPVKDGNTL